ncbi:PALB2 protein, partial [Brachypteracias leptosomus]|nr:PALB2 protein [Brachypteracias leptosomus]
SSSIIKQMDGEDTCEDQGELQRLLDLMSENEMLAAGGNPAVTDESRGPGGHPRDTNTLNPSPAGSVEELLENQQVEIQPSLSDPEKVAAPESSLSSCTVVEGLLFPVEYYVRTTRRVSACQRKVDLQAVLLSQLGRSKRGQRSKCRQKGDNSDQPSQERVENDLEPGVMLFPFLGAENDPTNPSSPQRSPPTSSGSSTSLGSTSQSSICSTRRGQRRSRGKHRGRRRSACNPPGHQGSQELLGSLDPLTPRGSSPLLPNQGQSEKENCETDLKKPSLDEGRGQSNPEGPASLGLPAVHPDTCSSLFSFRSPQWLFPTLDITDFHLPDEEFGLLKLEKSESSPVSDLEVFVPSSFGDDVAPEGTQGAPMNPEGKTLRSRVLSPLKNGLPRLPHAESPRGASKRDLSTHELLFTPTGTVSAGAPTQLESEVPSSVFPVVGATPALLPSVHSQPFPASPSAPPSQGSSSKAASAQARDGGEHKDSAILLPLDSCAVESAGKEEEQGEVFPLEVERDPDNDSDEAVAVEKHQQSEIELQGSCRAPPEQKKAAAEQLSDDLAEESLQLMSTLKDSSSSCAVDVSTTWWEAAGGRELCVVTASETSVSLWKPLEPNCWGKVHTWQFGEVPVIQIVPLPDTCNLICVALGDLEIGEIRLLLYCPESNSFKQSLVKTGAIKAVLGLRDRRLVSSSRTVQEQQVEIESLSETGRSKDRQTLMPPEETVLAFAEVEGLRDALVGTTAANSVLVWNLKTGQLLTKMHVGYSYPASICHQAYSDSGLLFVVLSHPHAKESESRGHPPFRVVAFNPRTARSRGVMSSSLPPGHAGRQGDVKESWAAAVLSSGTIAVWDLLLGHCTALLPPGTAGTWALARWATTSSCLLAGQRDGTICLYRYRQPQPGAA